MKSHPLLDALKKQLNIKRDWRLAEVLDVAPPVLSKIRRNKLRVGATLQLSIHEVTGMPFKEMRKLIRNVPEEL